MLVAWVSLTSADYEVRPGDTLARIARTHGTTAASIAELNGIPDPDLIRVGQILQIPGDSPSGMSETKHVVAPGESLARIASRYGTTVTALVELNAIRVPDRIYAGQELLLPGIGSHPTSADPERGLHVVQHGETLDSIAARYGTTAQAIAAANGIRNLSLIYAGNTLVIGAPPVEVAEGVAGTSTHTVGSGETLAGIAARYGTTIDWMVAENGLSDPNLIRAGSTLRVPAGAWVCPVAGATFFNDWGFPRQGGRFHQGTDLFAARGSEVRAPVSGLVTHRTGIIGGLQFWLEGDDGNLYVGTHMEAFGSSSRVSAGTVIGYVGDSGNALGASPHLHFEMHVDGSPVNPHPTLQSRGC